MAAQLKTMIMNIESSQEEFANELMEKGLLIFYHEFEWLQQPPLQNTPNSKQPLYHKDINHVPTTIDSALHQLVQD